MHGQGGLPDCVSSPTIALTRSLTVRLAQKKKKKKKKRGGVALTSRDIIKSGGTISYNQLSFGDNTSLKGQYIT